MRDPGQWQTLLPRLPVLLVENWVVYATYTPPSRYQGVPPCWSLAGPAEWWVLPLSLAGPYAARQPQWMTHSASFHPSKAACRNISWRIVR